MIDSVARRAGSDADLVLRIAGGDGAALSSLLDRYGDLLYTLAYRILGETVEAQDVVQETFLDVRRRATHYDPARADVFTWLVFLCRRRSMDRLRARRGTSRHPEEPAFVEDEAGRPLPEGGGDLEHAKQRAAVRDALNAIRFDERRALMLAYYEGLAASEIARELSMPLDTVKSHLRSGLLRLRDLLSRFGGEP
jgi:RNA polymerase sigma-70 factor (ECF subfamily)